MKNKDVISLAGVLMSKDNVVSYFKDGVCEDYENTMHEIDILSKCLHLVESEIASERFSLKKCETFSVINGKVEFSSFSVKPYRIISVYSDDGHYVEYTVYPDRIETAAEKIKVTYAVVPSESSLESESAFADSPVTDRVLALGTVAEYKLYEGLYDEAVLWRDKYEKALKSVLSPKGNLKMKGRAFV